MFEKSKEELEQLGAEITTREIKQQPELWQEAWAIYQENQEKIFTFLDRVRASAKEKVRVVFTGAGTSQYVGDTIVPYLDRFGDTDSFIFQSIGTTSLVATPESYLFEDETTILVSFARSGNSPESVAAVNIANQVVKNIFHLTVTCAPEGKLAQMAEGDEKNFLLLMPSRSNDAGFAMTGSFSCMTLSGLLIFDETKVADKELYIQALAKMGTEIVTREEEIAAFTQGDYERIVYLGTGSLMGLTREAQLKVLELTAGKIATVYDSSMGFRHGPKSFVNEKTLVFGFLSNVPYTRQYDVDVLEEISGDEIAKKTIAIGQKGSFDFSGNTYLFSESTIVLPDGYLALADIMVAQVIAIHSSIKVGNTPDTPSPSGTVNRVVKGVTIHSLS